MSCNRKNFFNVVVYLYVVYSGREAQRRRERDLSNILCLIQMVSRYIMLQCCNVIHATSKMMSMSPIQRIHPTLNSAPHPELLKCNRTLTLLTLLTTYYAYYTIEVLKLGSKEFTSLRY